jgi:hypothetical protein
MNARHLSSSFATVLSLVWLWPTLAAEETAERTQSCLPLANIRRTQILNDAAIVFATRDRKLYLNELARQCPGLRRNSQVSYTSEQRQLCAGASFQVLLRVGVGSNSESITIPGSNEHISLPSPAFVPGPVCTLGGFKPVTREEVDAIVEASKAQRSSRRRRREAGDAEPASAE